MATSDNPSITPTQAGSKQLMGPEPSSKCLRASEKQHDELPFGLSSEHELELERELHDLDQELELALLD